MLLTPVLLCRGPRFGCALQMAPTTARATLGPPFPCVNPRPPSSTSVTAPPHSVCMMTLVQSFVGSHYYCESGNSGPSWQARWYAEDILWDGSDCPHSDNHCCSSAAEPEEGMPWFRRSFDDATIAITVGLCSDQGRGNEDVGLVEMEMCVRVSHVHAHARPCGGTLFADGVVRCDNGAACAQVGQGRRRTVAGAAVRVVRGWQVRYCRGKGGRELPEVGARVAGPQPVFCSLAPVDSVSLFHTTPHRGPSPPLTASRALLGTTARLAVLLRHRVRLASTYLLCRTLFSFPQCTCLLCTVIVRSRSPCLLLTTVRCPSCPNQVLGSHIAD